LALRALREGAHQSVEYSQAGGRVDCLAQEASREASVQIHSLAAGEDLAGYGQGSGLGASCDTFTGELNADLDHIDRLNDGGGNHATDTAIDERKRGTDEGCVEEVGGDSSRVVSS